MKNEDIVNKYKSLVWIKKNTILSVRTSNVLINWLTQKELESFNYEDDIALLDYIFKNNIDITVFKWAGNKVILEIVKYFEKR